MHPARPHCWLSKNASSNKNYSVPAILQALFFTSKLMGAAPYNISSSGVLSTSRKWLWFSRFYHILMGVINLLQVIYYEITVEDTPPGLSRILFIFNYGVYGAKSVGIHLCILVIQHSRLRTLINYWRENSDEPPPDKRKLLVYVQWLALVLFCCTVMFSLNINDGTSLLDKGSFRQIVETLSYTLNEMSLFVVEIQFIGCILVLRKQFVHINAKLQQQIELLNLKEEVFSMLDKSRQAHKWLISQKLHRAFENNCSVAALRSHHAFLIGVSEDVNKLFTIPILAFITYCTSHAIVSSFAVISKTPRSFNKASWTSVYISRLIIIMLACHNTTVQADRTAKLVHKALNEETLTKEERKELKVFSQQLVHRKCVFHIYGFFRIDLQLIPKVLSVVTAYLVIMMQFELSLTDEISMKCDS